MLALLSASDSSFMALLGKLANLQLPNRGNELESCPICSEKFALEHFAAHVYKCITVSQISCYAQREQCLSLR